MLGSPEIKMFEKQVETDRDGGFKSSASRERNGMRQKLSAGVGGRRGATFPERAFFFFFFFLIHLTLAAGNLRLPQFVHLFINLSITTSPILCLHAQPVLLLLLLHEVCILLLFLSPLHPHADLALWVQRCAEACRRATSIDNQGAVGPSRCVAVVSVFDGGAVR